VYGSISQRNPDTLYLLISAGGGLVSKLGEPVAPSLERTCGSKIPTFRSSLFPRLSFSMGCCQGGHAKSSGKGKSEFATHWASERVAAPARDLQQRSPRVAWTEETAERLEWNRQNNPRRAVDLTEKREDNNTSKCPEALPSHGGFVPIDISDAGHETKARAEYRFSGEAQVATTFDVNRNSLVICGRPVQAPWDML